MTSSLAWQLHGCFNLNASYQFFDMPFTRARVGCTDDTQSMDHFNQASPSFLFVKQLFHALRDYPLLTDGLNVETLSQQTWNITAPTTKYVTNYTTVGVRSVVRGLLPGQGLSSPNMADKVWAVYSNVDTETSWESACSSLSSIKSPFPPGTLVRNILPPHQTFTIGGTVGNACLSSLRLAPFEFLALVPQSQWVEPVPKIVNFLPGHDARILREENVAEGTMVVELDLAFSNEMDCISVTNSVSVDIGTINPQSVKCEAMALNLGSAITQGKWHWKAKWENVPDGVHVVMAGKGAVTIVGSRKIEVQLLLRNLICTKHLSRMPHVSWCALVTRKMRLFSRSITMSHPKHFWSSQRTRPYC
jgi:alpha-1,3-glucan synthase